MPATTARRPASRNNDLAAIHIATKALGLTTEDAQALKLHVTGKASAKDMTVPVAGPPEWPAGASCWQAQARLHRPAP